MTLLAVQEVPQLDLMTLLLSQLAQNQRVYSDQYTSKTQSLNSGSSFDISLAVGTTKSAVAAVYNATATASETTTLLLEMGQYR